MANDGSSRPSRQGESPVGRRVAQSAEACAIALGRPLLDDAELQRIERVAHRADLDYALSALDRLIVAATGRSELLAELHALAREVERLRADAVLASLGDVRAALRRLHDLESTRRMLDSVTSEVLRSCGLERCIVFRASGGEISPESVDFGDPEWSEGFLTFGRRHPASVDHRDADAEVYRRRRTIMRDDAIAEAHGMRTIARAANASAYLAAPIQVDGAVIGTLHADCYWTGRQIDLVDRDTLAVFADGFGYALERTWLLERTRVSSDRARRALAEADAAFAQVADPGAPLDLADAMSPVRESLSGALLTRREVEVVELMARGDRNAEIAAQLVISESTVKAHVGNVLRKLHATNRSQAVARYLQLGRRS